MPMLRTLGNMFFALLRGIVAGIAWIVSKLYEGIEWLYHLRVELCYVEGKERNSGLPLAVLCGLRRETKNYVLGQIFAHGYRQQPLGRYWLWRVVKAIPAGASDCSMILYWTCESHLKRFASPVEWFLIPDWVYGVVSLPRDAEALHKVNGDIRRIRSRKLTYEITHNPKKFEDFYHNMHVPYISKTFGDSAYVLPKKAMLAEFRYGDLILIKQEERSIAGQLIWYCDDGPFLESMGIRDGDREHVKNGASCALYHYAMQYLEEKGFPKVIVGWSRPFLHDGVLQFKRKWSQVITDSRTWGFGLKILADEPATRSFLRKNPFIHNRDGRLHAAVFVDSDTAMEAPLVDQLVKDYFHAGLDGLEIYRLRPENAVETCPIEAELPEHVKVRLMEI